jgi:thioredoxin-like negative regulator of GroEL
MDTEKWDEAIKWLLHAMDALPDRTDFKVTLAEVYVMIEDRESFTELFEKLYVDIADHAEDKERLMIAARAFIPEHTVIQAEATAPEKQYALRSRSLRPTLAAI